MNHKWKSSPCYRAYTWKTFHLTPCYAVKKLLSILTLFLIGCSSSQQHVVQQPNPEADWPERFKSSNISFDFAGGLKNDSVQLVVEGKGIYEGTLTDDPIVGISDSITIKKPCDRIDVDLIISEKYYSSSFDLVNGHYFIITFYDDEISVHQEEEARWYD